MGDIEGLCRELDGGVLRLTIDRPNAGNAITPALREALIDEVRRAGQDLAVRAVLLTGAGDRHFCTGADLRAPRPPTLERPEGAPAQAVGEVSSLLRGGAQRLIAAVLDCPRPVVAAVNGTAAGLGANLAMACDLVLATESASFLQVFVRRGLSADAGTAFLLPRLVGLARAKELVFFGDALRAVDAERIGIVNRVVPDGELGSVAGEWAARLAAGPTAAIALSKRLLNDSLQSDRAAAFVAEADAQELASHTADFAEGLAAFAERRPALFHGW